MPLACCVDASGRHGALEGGDLSGFLRLQLCNRLLLDWCSRGRRFREGWWEKVLAILSHTQTHFLKKKKERSGRFLRGKQLHPVEVGSLLSHKQYDEAKELSTQSYFERLNVLDGVQREVYSAGNISRSRLPLNDSTGGLNSSSWGRDDGAAAREEDGKNKRRENTPS